MCHEAWLIHIVCSLPCRGRGTAVCLLLLVQERKARSLFRSAGQPVHWASQSMISAVAHVCAGMCVCGLLLFASLFIQLHASRFFNDGGVAHVCLPSPPSLCEAHTSPLSSFTAMFSCWRSRGTGKSKERKGINSVCNAFPTFLCVPQISTDSYVPLGVLAGGLMGEARGTPPLVFRGGFCLLPFAFVGAQVGHVRGKGDWSNSSFPR